jgi:LysR family transcriptional regulator, pca operon transcriptional activator
MLLDPRLKLRHLQALLAIDEERTVQGSAEALARTPSAVSKSLSELEAIVGQRLFDRTRRGLLPTQAGERLLGQVRRGLSLLGEAIEHTAGRVAGTGPVTVTMGVLPTAASTLAPSAVEQFQARHPESVVSVEQGTNIELLAKLRRRELDLVIGRLADAPLMFDLSFEPLYEEPLVLIAVKGHPLDGVRAPSMSKVFAYPVILPERDTIIRDTLEPVLIAAGLRTPPRSIETLSSAFASQLVIQSHAVWFCAPGVVARELADGRCVALDVDLGPTRRSVGLSARGDAPLSPAAAEMAELLRLQARRMRRAQQQQSDTFKDRP